MNTNPTCPPLDVREPIAKMRAQAEANRKRAAETLSRIREAKAWMSLLNVQTDAVYRRLVDGQWETVDAVLKDPDTIYSDKGAGA